MRSVRLGQTVVLMLIVALAASCAATKEYTSKLFPKEQEVKTETAKTLKFLELDKADHDKTDWVSTDIIMGRDTASKTIAALDNFSKNFPAGSTATVADTSKKQSVKTTPEVYVTKPVQAESEPVARYLNQGEIRSKRTRE